MNNNNDRKESERTKLENIRFIPNVRIQAEKVTKVRTVDEYGIPGKTEKREVVSFDLTEITVKELKELRKIKGVPMFLSLENTSVHLALNAVNIFLQLQTRWGDVLS